jgi:type II secretory pathway component PulF
VQILQEISDEPLGSATQEIFEQVSSGSTLSEAMVKRPDIFSRLYTQMVKVGEVGGILDETFLQVADLIESDWADSERTGSKCRGALVLCEEAHAFLADSAPEERLRILSLYFRSLGMMLAAGVPFEADVLWKTAAGILPPGPERDRWETIAERTKEGGMVTANFEQPFLQPFVARLVRIGIETGSLPVMCEKIAQLLEYQRRHYLLKQRERAT